MKDSRPHFREYVFARLVTLALAVFVLFVIFMLLLVSDNIVAYTSIFLFLLTLILFIYVLNQGAKRMEKELMSINTYLSRIEKIESIDYKTNFFTQEFEEINENLIKVLKGAKKREDIKHRYSAKLKLKNRQRAEMLSAIAHEFRNPIASIMGYAQTLQEDKDIPPSLQDKFLGKIYNNGNKIESLLSRLIMWNKFESKETQLHKSKFDIYTLSEEVKMALEETYPHRTVEIKGESRTVEADRTLMEVVLKNLMENALKYSKNSVILTVSKDKISVEDEGVGISEKDIEKVTKKFYRSTAHSWDNSMGLGLAIVKTILSLHGSKLEIKSQIDVGSKFSFKL